MLFKVLQCLSEVDANQLTRCGYFWSSRTFVLWSLMFRYWSTECSVPDIFKSFFSSIVTCTAARVVRCRHSGTHISRRTHLFTNKSFEVGVKQHAGAQPLPDLFAVAVAPCRWSSFAMKFCSSISCGLNGALPDPVFSDY